jgi:hypothetical protein
MKKILFLLMLLPAFSFAQIDSLRGGEEGHPFLVKDSCIMAAVPHVSSGVGKWFFFYNIKAPPNQRQFSQGILIKRDTIKVSNTKLR